MRNSNFLLCLFQSHALIEIVGVRRGGRCKCKGQRWRIVKWIQGSEVFKLILVSQGLSYLCWFIFCFCYKSGGVGKTWPLLHWVSRDCNKEVSHGLSWLYWNRMTRWLRSSCHFGWWHSKGWGGGCHLDWKIVIILLATVKERIKWNQCTGLVCAKSAKNLILSLTVLSWRSPRTRFTKT